MSRSGITDIENSLQSAIKLEISSRNTDVRLYLHESLHKQGHLSNWIEKDPVFESTIVDAILPRLSGMFLLARLYIDLLSQMHTMRQARKLLEELPDGTIATYQEAWHRVCAQNPYQAELGKKVISWIVCCVRPLSVLELQHGLAIEEGDAVFDPEGIIDKHSLTSACAGLVSIDEQNKQVSLVHPTANEYNTKHQHDFFPTGHQTIATACITYLLMDTFQEGACLKIEDFID